MEACNFGHRPIVELLLTVAHVDLDAVNLRGQRAEDVAVSRGHEKLAQLIREARQTREHPEELPRIRQLEEQVTRNSEIINSKLSHKFHFCKLA